MMPDYVEGTEIERLLPLLTEYTSKLRDACEERLGQRRARKRYLWLFLSTALGLVGFTLQFNLVADISKNYLQVTGSVLVAFAAITFFVSVYFPWLGFGPRDVRHEASELAAVVERLVRIVSQYSEHSPVSTGGRLEFEVRLVEAESVLRLYQVAFGFIGQPSSHPYAVERSK